MITVGYGDITPSNVYEAIFITVAMYFGCGFFSYILSYIQYLISEMKKTESEFAADMRIVMNCYFLYLNSLFIYINFISQIKKINYFIFISNKFLYI